MGFGELPGIWMGAILRPEETFEKESKKESFSWVEGAANYVVGLLVLPVVMIIYGLFLSQMVSKIPMMGASGFAGTALLGSMAVAGVLLYVGALVALFLISLLYHFLSRLLGGTGTAVKTYYLTSIPAIVLGISMVVVIVGMIIVMVLAMISPYLMIIGLPIAYILMLGMSVFTYYSIVLALKSTHGMGTLKAVMLWAASVVIVITALLIGASVVLGGLIMGALGGGAGGLRAS